MANILACLICMLALTVKIFQQSRPAKYVGKININTYFGKYLIKIVY